mmetsp:Transcript_23958/g.80928  ORF Transcript_23958/g.80928 Transcript_23958/m.80928 type:complete len:251 (-) Transcript_23958:261-1013(-)
MSRLPSGTRATPHRTPAGAPCSASILGRDRRVGRSGSDARQAGDAFAACGQGSSSTPLARFLRAPPLASPAPAPLASPPPAPRPSCAAATARASAEAGPPHPDTWRCDTWSISSGRPRSRRRAGAANSRHCVANAAATSASTRRTLASLHAAAPPCARHSRASRHLAVASPDLDAAPAAAPPAASNGKSSAAKLAWCAQNGVGAPNTAWPPPPAPSSLCSPAAPALSVVHTAAAATDGGAAAASGATYTW